MIDYCDECGNEDQLTRCPCGQYLCDPCSDNHYAEHTRDMEEVSP